MTVASARTGVAAHEAFRRRLFEAGLLIPTGIDGVYGRSPAYEQIVESFSRLVSHAGAADGAFRLHLPPVMARSTLSGTGYLRSFPNLAGSIHAFGGGDAEHRRLLRQLDSGGDPWGMLEPAAVVLCPAACHPLYPMCRGRLEAGSARFDVIGTCFRCEPSVDPARLQSFRMHEHVFVGDAGGARAHRDRWLGIAADLLSSLGLEVEAGPANDPFFGRAGRMLASSQLQEELKIELRAIVSDPELPTAVASGNYHQAHFGEAFDITTGEGEPAHSACVGFGTDRVALGLLAAHGLDPRSWPGPVRDRLWP